MKTYLYIIATVGILLFVGLLFAQVNTLPPAKQVTEDQYNQKHAAGTQNPAPRDPNGQYSARADPDPFKQLREEVAKVAASALPSYVTKVPKERINDFGFQSLEELQKATLLSPIPLFLPDRGDESLNRNHIEGSLNENPVTWIVPVSTGEHIACLIQVDSINGKPPEAVMFGNNYKAKRLESGLNLLGWPDISRLRFLSFHEPTVDLLLVQEDSNQWRWIDLKGTSDIVSVSLDASKVDELLSMIKNTKTSFPN